MWRGGGESPPRARKNGEDVLAKVKVEVVCDFFAHTVKNTDGTYTRREYVRGDVLEMDAVEATRLSQGEEGGQPFVAKNSSGTDVLMYPPKTPGATRASVKMVHANAPVSAPVEEVPIVPAPAPSPAPAPKFGRGE